METLTVIVLLLHALIVILSCAYVYFKTWKIYQLTGHKGLLAFRNAFMFWGIGFFLQFVINFVSYSILWVSLHFIFYYFITAAPLLLVYSLVWKELEGKKQLFLHLISLIVSALALYFGEWILFACVIAVLLYGANISYYNYQKAKKGFSQLYFIALVLGLIGYAANYVADNYLSALPNIFFYLLALDCAVFLTFAYGVYITLKWPRKEKG